MPPLADRLRPTSLDDVVGQRHLLASGAVFRRVVESGRLPNMIFYGPSGIGKTTVASILAAQAKMRLHILNGTTASTADIKAVVEELGTLAGANGILLYLDEIQYFNKKQQQTLLEHIENGRITLIASTTENPYFYVYGAILSRSTVFEFKPLEPDDVLRALRRALVFLREDMARELSASDDVLRHIASNCAGDVRKALNALELAALAAGDGGEITMEAAKQLTQRSAMRYDREGDSHYDILSAYQKSMRGSDPDAALHYLARLLAAGDLPSACRRLMVTACEDVGLAYPMIIPTVKACVDAAMQVGLPEAALPLGDAVILVATAPKSNSGAAGISAAMADVNSGELGDIPAHLKDTHYGGAAKLGRGGYVYPHGEPDHWTPQQYLPDNLADKHYYEYGENKAEQAAAQYWRAVRERREGEKK